MEHPHPRRFLQDRACGRGDEVRFIEGDVTHLRRDEVGETDFFLDVGCFHGLTDAQRAAMGERLTAVATREATLLVLAFRPGRRPLLPRGASRTDVGSTFPGWAVTDEEPADVTGMPGPLKRTAPRWYRLRRTSPTRPATAGP
ncbi:SAM-dependent methyltransferase [Blastococcus saxobsidens]|uniref:SAM-dependent methyltransferase n=1 Tax=Blastococcus saxobsidens TaxID=138336 RepID=UPI00140F6173|nr:SAM-dependent methyltransferase [Blastococcus saxobsidens]